MPGQIIHDNGHDSDSSDNGRPTHTAMTPPTGCPFKIRSADYKLHPAPTCDEHVATTDAGLVSFAAVSTTSANNSSSTQEAPLGPLSAFKGTFRGIGFNTIFRPNSGPPVPEADRTLFHAAVDPPPPTTPHEQTLELNLTTETLTFAPSLAQVPNRGLIKQGDINLNGIPYEQRVFDVTNTATGKADGVPQAIHFETGLFMHVPASSTPNTGATLCRMGSIPHGTTINAQCLVPTATTTGSPTISPVSIEPFVIKTNASDKTQSIPFNSTRVDDQKEARLPQDLSPFMAQGTITQELLDDPNSMLRQHIKGQNITSFDVFTLSTDSSVSGVPGGGIANIGFLNAPPQPNADVPFMSSTFWVERVQSMVEVPVMSDGESNTVQVAATNSRAPLGPTFNVKAPFAVTAPRRLEVTWTQIQYSQTVMLNFNGLSWPHVAVATLVPAGPLKIPRSAWGSE